jgi:lysyl-tRNA synthetase class 2
MSDLIQSNDLNISMNNSDNNNDILERLEYYKERIQSDNKFVKEYLHKFNKTIEIDEFIQRYNNLNEGDKLDSNDNLQSIMGRVISKRSSGKNLFFYTIISNGLNLQIMSDKRSYENEIDFKEINFNIRRGDVIGITGYPYKSKRGELSLIPIKLNILSPCFHMLPNEYFGIVDKEIRYGQRYLDLMVNNNIRNIFITRSKVTSYLRRFLEDRNFIEVETPVLINQVGGATAKPFKTFHNAMKQEMSLRIAPELYLKQLVIGGLDRVFEIGKQFRNESIDTTHNPEFTSCEFYMAGADYYDLMKMTEEFMSGLCHKIHGKYEIEYQGSKINFEPPYKTIDMMEELTNIIKEKLNYSSFCLGEDLSSDITIEILKDVCNKLNIKCTEPHTASRLIDRLVGEFIEPQCINPTFIINHPLVMSPLAKSHRENVHLTERFELFINGKEICNAYTELNDPIVQKERFMESQKDKDKGDDEVPPTDMDFVTALEYGLPPTGGWGIGIDRLVMFLTNNDSIREVILFPTRNTSI